MKNPTDAHKSVQWRMHGCGTNQLHFGSTRLMVEQMPRGQRALYIGQRFHAATKVLVVAQEQTSEKSEFRPNAGKPKLSILAFQTM